MVGEGAFEPCAGVSRWMFATLCTSKWTVDGVQF